MAWRWQTISHAAAQRASALWACQNWMSNVRPASRMRTNFATASVAVLFRVFIRPMRFAFRSRLSPMARLVGMARLVCKVYA